MFAQSSFIEPPPVHTHEHVIRLEVATEILNAARGKLFERIYSLEISDPQEAERLCRQARRLLDIRKQLNLTDPALTEQIITEWKDRLKDDGRFWAYWNEG